MNAWVRDLFRVKKRLNKSILQFFVPTERRVNSMNVTKVYKEDCTESCPKKKPQKIKG